MTDRATTGNIGRSNSATKRRSLLGDIGIKPADGKTTTSTGKPTTSTGRTTTSTGKTTPTTARTTPPGRKMSINSKPSSPSVSRTQSPNSLNRKGSVIERPSKTPTATTPPPRRRSIVPTSSNQKSTVSPIARRASINVVNSNATATHNKRLSSPPGLESLSEVQAIKNKLTTNEEHLQKKEEEIKVLKDKENSLKAEYEDRIVCLERELSEVKQSSANTNTIIQHDHSELEALENKLRSQHLLEIERLKGDHQVTLQSELSRLRTSLQAEYNHSLDKLKVEYQHNHSKLVDQLKKEHDISLEEKREEFDMKLKQREDEFERLKRELGSTIVQLNGQIKALEEVHSNSHVRKIENELNTANNALEEMKRQARMNTDNLERRYRDEIRQLQNGSDDTAQVWLEKTRAAQQEMAQLHDMLQSKEQEHMNAVTALKETHAEELDKVMEQTEQKEVEIEEQQHQIEGLLFQVETLQNSLEAATVRLENTTKSLTPSTSLTVKRSNDSLIDKRDNPHTECFERIEKKQKEIDGLMKRVVELKENQEVQMNKMRQEKASAMQELRKTITSLEQKMATPPTPPTTPHPKISDERLINIAEQHRNEIKMLHDQYQRIVNIKDQELEDYAYRIKALVASKQKDVENIHSVTTEKIDQYEKEIEGYEAKLKLFEEQAMRLQDKVSHWELLVNNNTLLIEDMKKGCSVHRKENQQLLK
ncbi:hypothetical protein BDB01DRAFT_771332 [Pilobolus umbonatus]|nr:hypothetical protein BDB01DRAFT_771332 [Pilobolus umbonatus]